MRLSCHRGVWRVMLERSGRHAAMRELFAGMLTQGCAGGGRREGRAGRLGSAGRGREGLEALKRGRELA